VGRIFDRENDMPGSRLLLVAEESRLSGQVLAHLRPALNHGVHRADPATVRQYLTPWADGLILLLTATPAEHEIALRLVQEVYLRKFPPVLLLLEAGADEDLVATARLEPYLAQRLRWPEEAANLVTVLSRRLDRVRPFPGTGTEGITEALERRLLPQTPSLEFLLGRLALAAEHDVTVLLTGETGTGKTHLAQLMHECSPRRGSPFLVVPCGAIPPNLMESAFFGHVRGAFTGADRDKVGKFEAAGSGTLLLDEIDALPLEQQAGLLRVIETGEFEPVGSNETRRCRARLIVASNWDLDQAVRQGRFRQDLFYRLNGMSFHLPPLRDRVGDIAPLVRMLTATYNARFHKDLFDIALATLEALESHPWPGNIRQLENAVQQAVLMSKGSELVADHLPADVRRVPPPATNGTSQGALLRNRDAAERQLIERALATNHQSRTRTAHALGISRVTLYKKMKKYGLLDVGEDDS
jgi:DNA-binding NtrC family response regulator